MEFMGLNMRILSPHAVARRGVLDCRCVRCITRLRNKNPSVWCDTRWKIVIKEVESNISETEYHILSNIQTLSQVHPLDCKRKYFSCTNEIIQEPFSIGIKGN